MTDPNEATEKTRPRILVVDDEPRSVELMARALRRVGVVDTASSGDEAAKKILAKVYHLVITDHRMPGMQGAELLALVASHDERIGRVLITGYADMKATVDAINQGRLHAYVSKPWKPDQLALIAQSLIERSELSRRNDVLLEQLSKRNEELEIAMAEVRRFSRGRRIDPGAPGANLPISPLAVHVQSTLMKISSGMSERAFAELQPLVRTCDDVIELMGEAGVLTLARHASVDDVLRGVLTAIAEDARNADVRLAGSFGCASSPPLDGPRLSRAFENLLRNAIEASPKGGEVRVESFCRGGAAIVRVEDRGTGWPEAIRDDVFEPFVSYAKPGHCGLGLSLVRRVVEAHGGTVQAQDGAPTGAVVEVRLPIP
jgi:signal transduction histidine kinase